MRKSIMYVGLDQHKESIEIATADEGRDGEVRRYGRIDGELHSLDQVVRKLVSTGKELRFVYEAGPCGYHLYRYLTTQGLECKVVAPSLIPKKRSDRVKTDRRDAMNWVGGGGPPGERPRGKQKKKLLLHRVLEARSAMQLLAQPAAAIQITQHGFG